MDEHHRTTITAAEVLGDCGGVDDATGQPVVVLTLRPNTGSGWGHVNYALSVDNAEALVGRLIAALDNPMVKPHRRPAADDADLPTTG